MTRSLPSSFENSSATSTNLCVLKYVWSADTYRTLLSDILVFRYCKTMVDLPDASCSCNGNHTGVPIYVVI